MKKLELGNPFKLLTTEQKEMGYGPEIKRLAHNVCTEGQNTQKKCKEWFLVRTD